MRIVDRKTFLAMPENTVFSKYKPCYFDHVAIKEESITFPHNPISAGDFRYQSIEDSMADWKTSEDLFEMWDQMETQGKSFPMEFDTSDRDGMFDKDQLFAVWEKQDVQRLIDRLQKCLDPKSEGVSE